MVRVSSIAIDDVEGVYIASQSAIIFTDIAYDASGQLVAVASSGRSDLSFSIHQMFAYAQTNDLAMQSRSPLCEVPGSDRVLNLAQESFDLAPNALQIKQERIVSKQ